MSKFPEDGTLEQMSKWFKDNPYEEQERINQYVDQAGRKLTDGRRELNGIVHDYEATSFDEFPPPPKSNV